MLNVMWQPGREGGWGRMDTSICMAESLLYSPETTTTLLIGYNPIQNKNILSIVGLTWKVHFPKD